jgi:hypothetical protein
MVAADAPPTAKSLVWRNRLGRKQHMIAAISNGTLLKPESNRATADIEEWSVRLFDSLKEILSHAGVKQDFNEVHGEAAGDLKSDLKRFVAEHQQNALLVHRSPCLFTKHDFEQALRKVSRRVGKKKTSSRLFFLEVREAVPHIRGK